MFEGVEVDQKIKETVAHLWAYVDVMMPASLYSEELRQRAVMDMAWVVTSIVINEAERERVGRKS